MRRNLRVTARKTKVQRGKLLTGLQQQGSHWIRKPTVFGQLWERHQEPIGRATDNDAIFGEEPT